jgi:hypothetical protein
MPRSSVPRRRSIAWWWLCCGGLVGALSGCHKVNLEILANTSSESIHVRYAIPKYSFEDRQPVCPGRPEDPQVTRTPTKGKDILGGEEWRAAPGFTWDPENCEMAFTLEPGFSGLIARVGYCEDYKRHIDSRTNARPNLEYLVIESTSRTLEWRGWDVAKQFRRVDSMACIYRFG